MFPVNCTLGQGSPTRGFARNQLKAYCVYRLAFCFATNLVKLAIQLCFTGYD